MNPELKTNETQAIKNFLQNHPHARMIRNYRHWQNFKVEDVLVRHHNDSKQMDPVSIVCQVPKKFKIVHIDDIGCPWIKNVNVRGGLGHRLYCLVDSTTFTYKIDPELIDCLLFGSGYDPRAQYRNWRRENPDYGG